MLHDITCAVQRPTDKKETVLAKRNGKRRVGGRGVDIRGYQRRVITKSRSNSGASHIQHWGPWVPLSLRDITVALVNIMHAAYVRMIA